MIRSLPTWAAIGACAAASAALAANTNWPQFRGPAADGCSEARDVPIRWSATENVAWTTEIPGAGWSSPVIDGGKVFLTSALVTDGSDESNPRADRSLRALCLDAATGRVLWNVEVFKQDGSKAPNTIHRKNGHASPTPIVTTDRVFVHFGHQGCAALDHAGKKIWENRSFRYAPRHGAGGSPVLAGGRLIFNCDAEDDPFILALDPRSGATAWRKRRPPTEQKQKFAFATCAVITVDGRPQVVSPGAGAVDAFDPANGSHLWRVRYEGYSNVPQPVHGNGLVYVSSSYDTPDVYAIDPENAVGDITDTHVKWTNGDRAPMTVTPLVVGSEIYWVADQGGIMTCADALTGTIHWQERLGGRAHSASPICAGGHIYVMDEAGRCVVLKAGRSFEKISENDLGERTLATPAPTEGALIVRTETKLRRIGR